MAVSIAQMKICPIDHLSWPYRPVRRPGGELAHRLRIGDHDQNDSNACTFEDEERDLPEVDTQLIPERNSEIEKYGKNL